jgi:hypothetical protein
MTGITVGNSTERMAYYTINYLKRMVHRIDSLVVNPYHSTSFSMAI